MAHARTLLTLEDASSQLELYELIMAEGLSVRKVEEYVRAISKGEKLEDIVTEERVVERVKKTGLKKATPEEFDLLKKHLSKYFQTNVQLTCNESGKGRITIPFKTEDELERIIALFDQVKK